MTSKKWNQDPRGRRGQPLQVREPLPGAEDEDSRQRMAGMAKGRRSVDQILDTQEECGS